MSSSKDLKDEKLLHFIAIVLKAQFYKLLLREMNTLSDTYMDEQFKRECIRNMIVFIKSRGKSKFDIEYRTRDINWGNNFPQFSDVFHETHITYFFNHCAKDVEQKM